MTEPVLTWTRWLNLIGNGLYILAIYIAAALYRGRVGERYSMLNHYISELGEVGVSREARLFNSGLIGVSIMLLPFIISIGARLGSFIGWAAAASSAAAGVCCALVGVYPMNNIKPHARAAVGYFRLGLLSMLLMGIALLAQPGGAVALPRWLGVLALLNILPYGAFMAASYRAQMRAMQATALKAADTVDIGAVLDTSWQTERPRFWLLPALEWTISGATTLWFLLAALVG